MEKWKNFALAFGVAVLWVIIMHELYMLLYPPTFPSLPPPVITSYSFLRFLQIFVWGCVFAPVIEDVIFRWTPINLMESLKWSKDSILYGVIITSALFGWYHAMDYYHIIIQGVVGVILSWLYIKNKSLLMNILFHTVYNFYFIFLV